MKRARKYFAAVFILYSLPAWATEVACRGQGNFSFPLFHSPVWRKPANTEDSYNCPVQASKKIVLPVMLDGGEVAEAHMDKDMRVDAEDISAWVTENMNDAAAEKFRMLAALGIGTVTAGRTEKAGFTLAYDAEEAVLEIKPDPGELKKRQMSLEDGAPPTGQEVLHPAGLSAFVNLRGGETYVDDGIADGRQPAQIDLDGALNMKGWVTEGNADYLEDDAHPWTRGNMRLVHDWQDKMVRMAVGDLSYPVTGFQSFQPMLGVSIARNFDLQPYRVTTPTGETSFTVRTPSRVDVVVNGQKVRTMHINPGPYSVSDFPVTDGNNDVTLVITDATGHVEEKTFSLLGDQQLLKQGLHAYAYNLGIESQLTDRQIHYESDRPAASFFHRYGFSDTLTAGVSAQGDQDVQQAGVSVLRAFAIGIVGLESFATHTNGYGDDVAESLSFRWRNAAERRDFSALLQYKGQDFSTLGAATPLNTDAVETAVRYSQPIFDDINAGIGGRYRFGRSGADDDWSYSISCSKTVSSSLTVTLNGEQRRTDGAGIFIGVTWSPPQEHHSFSATADTLAGTQTAEWRYRADRALDSLQGGVGVTHNTGGSTSDIGDISYTGYRGDISLRHDLTTGISGQGTDSRTEALFGTAIAYAGGHVAVTRPVTGSFVMLAEHKSLDGHDIGINPETATGVEATGYQARIDSFGPAVLPDATAYMYRPIKVDTRNLPPGYDIGRDTFTALPTYKSGTVLLVGNAANIFADGYFLFADGTPVALQAGIIRDREDKGFQQQEFFTNAQGRFRITHLQPGTYDISFYKYPDEKTTLVIPDNTPVGRMDAGKLVLSERS